MRIHSHTDPVEALFAYPALKLFLNGQQMPLTVTAHQIHGKGCVAKFAEIEDRNQAEALKGGLIQIEREAFEDLDDDEYYWDDLVGMTVVNQDGVTLGKVDHLFNAGASDIMVVKGAEIGVGRGGGANREYMIPFILDEFVLEADLALRKIVVDWDEDF